MLRYAAIFLVMMSAAWGQTGDPFQQEINLEMCRSIDHRFDPNLNECIYCAHGLRYNTDLSICEGIPDVLGKCYGEDHYHAATQECMYCPHNYMFDENARMCVEKQ